MPRSCVETSSYSDETHLRIVVDAHWSDSCRPEALRKASSMQWARAEYAAFSQSKRTSRTIMGARCGDERTGGPPSNGTSVHWACAESAAFRESKRTSRTIMGARCGDARTGGAPSNGTSVHWACAENAAFSESKCTSRTIMGARCGDARTGGARSRWYQRALGTCRKCCV